MYRKFSCDFHKLLIFFQRMYVLSKTKLTPTKKTLFECPCTCTLAQVIKMIRWAMFS